MKAEVVDGKITLTGNQTGSQIVAKASFADNVDSSGSTIKIGSTNVAGTDASGGTGATKTHTSTNGAAAKPEVAGTFDIDLSNAKFDVGIETYSLNGGADEAVNTGTVTTESVASLDLSTAEGAQNAIDVLDAAMEQVDEKRAEIGAFQNRMNHTMSNLANINENVNASNSRIKDVDFASETINMTKGQILQQAGTSILAQAKQIPQAALSLLG
ncbi:flagellin [Photobacterium leiognathi]|uniref:flagellin n=1 Tax=Photobacterium leiognathi TaxID=553611 RepID=UPI003F750ECB